MTNKAIMAELARLTAENDRLKAAKTKSITCKVGEKGGISVYGLGRFPVTLYWEQWERLLSPAIVQQINDFANANSAKLAVKE